MKLAYKMQAALEETSIKRVIYDSFITCFSDQQDDLSE